MKENRIDYKMTIWGSMTFRDDCDMNTLIEKLESGVLPSELADEELGYDSEFNINYETEEFLPPEENDGHTTIEVWKDGEIVWDNSFESEAKRKLNTKTKNNE